MLGKEKLQHFGSSFCEETAGTIDLLSFATAEIKVFFRRGSFSFEDLGVREVSFVHGFPHFWREFNDISYTCIPVTSSNIETTLNCKNRNCRFETSGIWFWHGCWWRERVTSGAATGTTYFVKDFFAFSKFYASLNEWMFCFLTFKISVFIFWYFVTGIKTYWKWYILSELYISDFFFDLWSEKGKKMWNKFFLFLRVLCFEERQELMLHINVCVRLIF